MGHVRLGRLPKSERWLRVVGLLGQASPDAAALTQATLLAAERQLQALGNDAAFSYPFWLLARTTWASRSDDFGAAMAEVGIPVAPDTSALAFVSMIADRVRAEAQRSESSALSQLSALALSRALNETLVSSQRGLFDASVQDLQAVLRRASMQSQFEEISHRYFGDFLGRTLTYFLDREAINSAANTGLASVADSRQLLESVDRHARESARIVRRFAGDWYSKHQWQSKGEITREEAHAFVAYALRKLRSELRRELPA